MSRHSQQVMRQAANRPPPLFVADALGLDFLNSIAKPSDELVEWIGGGADLLAWLAQARLVPEDVLAALRGSALPGELDAIAAQARALREWFRGFVQAHKGRPLQASALAQLQPLNAVLARDEAFDRVVARPHGRAHDERANFERLAQRRWRSPDTLLLPIATALADLVCEDFR